MNIFTDKVTAIISNLHKFTEREKAILSIHTGYKLTYWEEMFKVAEEITGERCSNTFLLVIKILILKSFVKGLSLWL